MRLPEYTSANQESCAVDGTTPVFLTRKTNPVISPDRHAVFADDVWYLDPGLFEAHSRALSLNFTRVPAQYRTAAKIYIWLLINPEGRLPQQLADQSRPPLRIRTIAIRFACLLPFFQWLDRRSAQPLNTLTAQDYSHYLTWVLEVPIHMNRRRLYVAAVQTFWADRDILPPDGRLPEIPPWDGENAGRVVGGMSRRAVENTTPRIPEAVMTPLLAWSIRFVEVFARDILDALAEYRLVCNRTEEGRRAGRVPSIRENKMRSLDAKASELFDRCAQIGRPLPGKRLATGELVLHVNQLSRLLDCSNGAIAHRRKWVLEQIIQRGLSLADGAPMHNRVTGQVDGAPWRLSRITYRECLPLARHLSTAAFIIIVYLSGMRVGEALNLERGCAVHDPITGLDYIQGREFKGVRDSAGAKLAEGAERRIPWTVIPLVVRAITTVESVHSSNWLFPSGLEINGHVANLRSQGMQARQPGLIGRDILAFISWVNRYCDEQVRSDRIPHGPEQSSISASQFRRTLAWYICRRPRGLVAAAIQYGHVRVRITQGYAGTAASGFPDDYAFEESLGHADQAMEDERLLREGERVSGPAAGRYRERTAQAVARFGGRVILTQRQANNALNSPELQIYRGRGMTCVFDGTKALCELLARGDDPKRTPDLDNCRAACQNIARTDRDLQHVRRQLAALRADADDLLAPEPLRMRASMIADHMQAIVDAHEAQPATPSSISDPQAASESSTKPTLETLP